MLWGDQIPRTEKFFRCTHEKCTEPRPRRNTLLDIHNVDIVIGFNIVLLDIEQRAGKF